MGEILAANKCTNRFGGGLPAKKDECGQFVLRGRGSSFLPFGTFWLGNQLKIELSNKTITFLKGDSRTILDNDIGCDEKKKSIIK